MIALLISNKIIVGNNEGSKMIKFRDNNDSYGFEYSGDQEFFQQLRLGVYLRSPKFPTKEKVYRQQNGSFRYGNVIIDKSIELHTDLFDIETHEALMVAMKHSEFYINDKQYFSQGELDLEDNEYNDLSNGKATLYEQGFNQTNIQC
jgi:hypothetical protein